MKNVYIFLLFAFLLASSCTGSSGNLNHSQKNSAPAYQTVAVFKSLEHTGPNECKLVFRKLDDCQYIILKSDLNTIEPSDLFFRGTGGEINTNSDYINFRYRIDYIQEQKPDSQHGENQSFNRLVKISRASSDRFSEAGFQNDLPVYDFVISLKQSLLFDSTEDISQMISYPIHALIKKKRVKINKPEEFVRYYHSIITKKIRDSVLNLRLADIKPSPKGVIIGDDNVLIKLVDDKILIASLNGY